MESKTVDKILDNVVVEALADTSPDTLSQVVAKRIADTNLCGGQDTGQKQRVTLLLHDTQAKDKGPNN